MNVTESKCQALPKSKIKYPNKIVQIFQISWMKHQEKGSRSAGQGHTRLLLQQNYANISNFVYAV